MDADASTGMLIGLTQTFPNGSVRYSQFKEGGTSLASPLLAGVVADADQAAGGSIGFLNPTLYAVTVSHPSAFNDIVPAANPNATAVIRVDFAQHGEQGQRVCREPSRDRLPGHRRPTATAPATVHRGSSP